MKGDEFLEKMELIDDKIIKEAEEYREKNTVKRWLPPLAAAAAVLLVVGLAAAIGVIRRLPKDSPGAEETNPASFYETRQETRKAVLDETRNAILDDGDSDAADPALWETGETVSGVPEETVQETIREQSWEERPLRERYPEFNFAGRRYSVRAVVPESRVLEKLGDLLVVGQDPFTGEEHEIEAEVFRMSGLLDQAAVVLRYAESADYYCAVCPLFESATLGSFMGDVDFAEEVSASGYASILRYDEDGSVHRFVYDGLTTEYMLSFLSAHADAPSVNFDETMGKPENIVAYMSFAIDAPDFNRMAVSVNMTKTGYLWTNVFDVGKAFDIGPEAVQEFENYLTGNLPGEEEFARAEGETVEE